MECLKYGAVSTEGADFFAVNSWFVDQAGFGDFQAALVQLQVQENMDDVDGINLAKERETLRPLVNEIDLRVSYNTGNFVTS